MKPFYYDGEKWVQTNFIIDQLIQDLKRLARAQNQLLICYRLGRRPAGWVLDTISELKHLIEEGE